MPEIARIELDPKDPPIIPRDVEVPTAKGVRILPVRYRYRNREELAELFQRYNDRAEADELRDKTRPIGEAAPTLREREAAAIEADISTLQDLLDGWGLDLPFTADSLRKLCVQHPGAPRAIARDYRAVMAEGRLGN